MLSTPFPCCQVSKFLHIFRHKGFIVLGGSAADAIMQRGLTVKRGILGPFGMSDFLKASITEFNDVDELRDYFVNMIDSYVYHMACEKECIDCHQRQIQRCAAGCMAFVQHKLNLISEAKSGL